MRGFADGLCGGGNRGVKDDSESCLRKWKLLLASSKIRGTTGH